LVIGETRASLFAQEFKLSSPLWWLRMNGFPE
jgi:hypothetical protein